MGVIAALGRDLLALFELTVLVATWTLLGAACIPKRFLREQALLGWTTAFALGSGITALVVVLLGGLRLLGRGSVELVTAASIVVGIAQIRRVSIPGVLQPIRGAVAHLRDCSRLERTGWTAAAGLFVVILFATLAPPSAMDATVYHLRIPKEFLATGSWNVNDVTQSYYPLNVEMLYLVGLAIGGPTLAALLHCALGAAAVLTACAWTRQLGDDEGAAVWAALSLGMTALFTWESTSAFIDLGTALWCSLALLWAARARGGGAERVLAGLLAGFAAGSKLTGALVGVLACATALMVAPRGKRRAALGQALVVGVVCLACVLPWYLRDWQLTGNPIYPVAWRWLGGPSDPTKIIALSTKYGYGRSVGHLLLAPFELLARSDEFDQGWSVGPALVALAPLGFAVARRGAVRVSAAVACAAWCLIWFWLSPQTRLLLPVLPILAGFAGLGAAAALRSRGALRFAAMAALVITAAEGLALGAAMAATSARVVLGLESAPAFLRRLTWHYGAYEETDRRLPADAYVAVEGADNPFYLNVRNRLLTGPKPSVEELVQRGFTHNLDVEPCPLLPPASPTETTLWQAEYTLRLSRLRGGVRYIRCARLTALPRSK
ncbi:MAG TPA: hypothetical protein VN962_20510 [Polyangia bacterium]|nr:hypothetical protein [Polyangia bacterium]